MAIVFKTPKSTLNTTSKQIQNLGGDCPPCPEPVLEGKELEYTQNGEYTVTPEQGVDGFSSIDVTVNVPSDINNQNKSVTITENGTSTVSADSGYSGLGDVTVEVNVVPTMAIAHIDPSTEHQTITPPAIYDGYASIEVNAVTNQIDSNIAAGNIKDGVTILGVTGNYSGSAINNQNKTVSPSTSQQSVSADQGYTGLGTVTVNAVTSSIDQNIAAGNIKNGVSILGVTGTYNPIPDLQAKTVNPSTSQQTVTPDQGKDGLSSVTVNAVTAAIDANIQAENILDGVTILGVTGSDLGYDIGYSDGYAQGQAECPEPGGECYTAYLQDTITTNGTYTYDPSDYQGSSYDAFDGVEITVNVPSGGSGCLDSINYTCNDIGLYFNPTDVAYTATVKNNNKWDNNTSLVLAPKTSSTSDDQIFYNCPSLKFVPNFTLTSATPTFRNMFAICSNLEYVGDISCPNGYATDAAGMFISCRSLKHIGDIDLSHTTNVETMFLGAGCIDQNFVDTCINSMDFSSVENFRAAFASNSSGKAHTYTTAPNIDMSSAVSVERAFDAGARGNHHITTVPQYDWGNVENVNYAFANQTGLTTIGGFVNLGKAFKSTGTSLHHLLDFTSSNTSDFRSITKQSVMNIINNLAAPDDPDVNDATLKLNATVYALLDASDIAIATAKNWSVISA